MRTNHAVHVCRWRSSHILHRRRSEKTGYLNRAHHLGQRSDELADRRSSARICRPAFSYKQTCGNCPLVFWIRLPRYEQRDKLRGRTNARRQSRKRIHDHESCSSSGSASVQGCSAHVAWNYAATVNPVPDERGAAKAPCFGVTARRIIASRLRSVHSFGRFSLIDERVPALGTLVIQGASALNRAIVAATSLLRASVYAPYAGMERLRYCHPMQRHPGSLRGSRNRQVV